MSESVVSAVAESAITVSMKDSAWCTDQAALEELQRLLGSGVNANSLE